ncbi:MAG: DNA topoisomerase VI subunit B [Candidatus Woesearchaeota archaeon]
MKSSIEQTKKEEENKKEISNSKNNNNNESNGIAFELAKKQREISIAEFFEKNRHLLGFDNKRKALLTAVKEAVDNSLDACEEARILPEIKVEITEIGEEKFKIIVEDNGPGIVKDQIPKVFAKLLYGSKFHTLKQSRGQQGIGISAAVLYAQLTTGRPAKITSKIKEEDYAHFYQLHINTQENKPEVVEEKKIEWNKESGTKIEIDIEATYQKGDQSVDEYLKQTAIINPYATIIYINPKSEQQIFSRTVNELPKKAKEIKPHPYGIELGRLIRMLHETECRTLQSFLITEFSRVGPSTAKEICEKAALLPQTKPNTITREEAEKLIKAIKETKIIAPETDCLSPIGAKELEEGLRKEFAAEFYTSTQRPPAVYRGNPFIIECALAYSSTLPADQPIILMRFANKVPLLYQKSACAITKTVSLINWKQYGLQHTKDSLPIGPVILAVHFASVWAPFTSEAKEAIAHYPEIMREIKLAVQECARELYVYLRKKQRFHEQVKKKGYIEKYIPHISESLKEILNLKDDEVEEIKKSLEEILEKTRKIEELEAPEEFDEEQRIGIKGEVEEEVEYFEEK